MRATAETDGLPPSADELEPRAFVGANAAFVPAPHAQHHVVQAQDREAVVEHQSRGLRAIALTPTVALADQDAKRRRAILMIDVVETGYPDRTPGITYINREPRQVLICNRAVVPLFLGLQRERTQLRRDGAVDLKIVCPTRVQHKQIPTQRSESDAIADNVQNRFVFTHP